MQQEPQLSFLCRLIPLTVYKSLFTSKAHALSSESELVIQRNSDWQMLIKRDRLRMSSLPF